jgi:hypothetical protein
MIFEESRQTRIEILACDGNLGDLKALFQTGYSQLEIDAALVNAIAYSRTETAAWLLSIGADISNNGYYDGVYYSVHNNELEGLKFAISNGVDVNIRNGMLLNASIVTAYNTRDLKIAKWLLENGAEHKMISESILENFGTDEMRSLLENTNTPPRK